MLTMPPKIRTSLFPPPAPPVTSRVSTQAMGSPFMVRIVLSWMLVVSGALAWATPPEQDLNVFGRDERVNWESHYGSGRFPYHSIGKVGWGCTGAQVGKRLVVTAA